jgi:hypothetical protein
MDGQFLFGDVLRRQMNPDQRVIETFYMWHTSHETWKKSTIDMPGKISTVQEYKLFCFVSSNKVKKKALISSTDSSGQLFEHNL